MNCPKCESKPELVRVTVAEFQVEKCPECGGVWFDAGELEEIFSREETKALRALGSKGIDTSGKKAPCPVCGGEGNMVPVKSLEHGIRIDTCPVCYGKWLDGKELRRLQAKGLFKSVAEFFRRFIS